LEWSARAQEVLRHLSRPSGADVEILKQSPRRAVLRIRGFSTRHASVIVKGFPLCKLESRFKYKKYGLSEFKHYGEAARRGVATPICHGYFEVRSWGMVAANGVIIEDLGTWRSLGDCLAAEPERSDPLLARAIPVLCRLYETGVNHIDPSPQNMLLAPVGPEVRLIDWQYASFVPPRQSTQLLLQSAHFLNYAKVSGASAGGRRWLKELWTAAQAAGCALGWEPLVGALDALQRRGRLGASERLALTLDEGTARWLRA
jgi:hypothetical protein